MFGLLEGLAIKPWEFGELTIPMLEMLARKGAPEETAVGRKHEVHRALDVLGRFKAMQGDPWRR